jgi:hypothetical protein
MTSSQVEAFLKRTTPQERVGAEARDLLRELRRGENVEWRISRIVNAASELHGWEYVSVRAVEDYLNHGLEDLSPVKDLAVAGRK